MMPTMFIFVFMERRPTSSTFFPYTTLFRSWTPEIGSKKHQEGSVKKWRFVAPVAALAAVAVMTVVLVGTGTGATKRQDRKSTRLNSSHSSISYAVFCLKKKNKETTCGDLVI